MRQNPRVHLVALGLFALLLLIIIFFWSNPKALVYLLLGLVALLAYGALYFIVAARMDPREPSDVVPEKKAPKRKTTKKKATKKKTTQKTTKKKATKKKAKKRTTRTGE